MTTFNTRVTFDHVRNSSAGFTSSNLVLGYGVTGLETDTGRIKVGDGVTPWNSLVYSTAQGVLSINGFTASAVSVVAGSNVTVSSSQGQVTISAAGNVASVNSKTGTVVLNASDVSAVISINGLTGTPTIISGGGGITVATSASSIVITGTTAAGGGGASSPTTVSVSTVTVSQNNWNIGEGDIFYLYSDSTNSLSVTGIATTTSTMQRLLINESTHTSASFTIKHQNTNSTAALRLVVPWAGDYVISPNGGAALIVRNASNDRWRVV